MSTALLVDRLETGLRLEPQHAHIARRLATYDPALRLRKSVVAARRQIGCGHILERRSRDTAPIDSKDPDVRIATRDGYVIISPVHVSYLMREEAIVEALIDGDMAHQTTGERFQRLVNAQADAKAKRRKDRVDDWRAFFRESYDVMERLGDSSSHAERTRLNNAGVEPFTVNDRRRVTPEGFTVGGPAAGESPVQETSSCPKEPSAVAS